MRNDAVATVRGSEDSKRNRRGNSVIEVSLMAPWILLLFIAVFDFGFYVYAAISVENAARVAALHTSSAPTLAGDSSTACFYAMQELQRTANVAALPANFGCGANPLVVTASPTTVNGIKSSQVMVQYDTGVGIPLPWFPANYRITRFVSMRMSDETAIH